MHNNIPLTSLAWDIETSTITGKFDNNALNSLNNVICIGCSFYDCDQTVSKFCITYLPCSNNSKSRDTSIIMTGDEREMLL